VCYATSTDPNVIKMGWTMYAYFDAADLNGHIVETWNVSAYRGAAANGCSNPVTIFKLPKGAHYGRLVIHNDSCDEGDFESRSEDEIMDLARYHAWKAANAANTLAT